MIRPGEVEVYASAEQLARGCAERFVRTADDAVRQRGRFAVALTGGGSPRELYRLLATAEFSERVDWRHVHLFWGDERAVPPGHPRSNFGMAHRLLVGRVPVPQSNVHRMRGELGAQRGAREYEAELRHFFGDDPRFDLVHLGLGGNGHVLSLFPFTRKVLFERQRWVVPACNPEIGEPRVTLTPPALNAAACIQFLVPDGSKAGMVRTAMRGPVDPVRVPAQLARAARGALVWSVTRAALDGASLADASASAVAEI